MNKVARVFDDDDELASVGYGKYRRFRNSGEMFIGVGASFIHTRCGEQRSERVHRVVRPDQLISSPTMSTAEGTGPRASGLNAYGPATAMSPPPACQPSMRRW